MKPRFFFLLPLFLDGGVERWALNWSRALRDYRVFFLVHGQISSALEIPEEIEVCQCGGTSKQVRRVFSQWDVNRGDVVISALTPSNIIAVRLKFRFGFRLITSIHVSLGRVAGESFMRPLIRRALYEGIGLLSDTMVAVSQGIASETLFSRPRVIYNPVIGLDDCQHPMENGSRKGVLAVGRLEPQKGFDLLIRAYALCSEGFRSSHPLTIVGEGKQHSALTDLIRHLGLEGSVQIHGFTRDIFSFYRNSRYFVLSSRYEGFGNVLAEALASGCRCLAFDVPHGPREILAQGHFGALIRPFDIEALGLALQKMETEPPGFPLDELRSHCRVFSHEYVGSQIQTLVVAGK